MNLQDILTLVSGPQGWLLIGGGILLLLVLLVYRRIGKLAAGTRNDLAEMRQTMAQLADRLDAVSESSVEATYGYAVAPATEDGADLTEAEAVFSPDAVSELSGELPDAAEEQEASVEATYDYAVAPATEDGENLTEAGAMFVPDSSSELPGEWPGAEEEPETSVEATYDHAVAPASENDTELTNFGEGPTSDVIGELPEELQDAAEAREDFDEFQFGTADLLAGPDKESSLQTEQLAADEQEASFQSSGESESFTFGSGGQISEGDAGDLAQSESREEPSPAIQPSRGDALEATSQAPSEIAIDSTTTSQSAPQVSTLEPLPGDPDRPQVGVARCGECGRKIAYPKRLSGKRMRCPACRATSILP